MKFYSWIKDSMVGLLLIQWMMVSIMSACSNMVYCQINVEVTANHQASTTKDNSTGLIAKNSNCSLDKAKGCALKNLALFDWTALQIADDGERIGTRAEFFHEHIPQPPIYFLLRPPKH